MARVPMCKRMNYNLNKYKFVAFHETPDLFIMFEYMCLHVGDSYIEGVPIPRASYNLRLSWLDRT